MTNSTSLRPVRRSTAFAATLLLSIVGSGLAEEESKSRSTAWKDGRIRGLSALILLNDPLIQEELSLTKKQRQATAEAAAEYLGRLRTLYAAVVKAKDDPQERAAKLTAMNRERGEMQTEMSGRLHGRLDDVQRRRLEEIVFRLRGFEIFFAADVRESLRLDAEQQAALAALRQSVIREVRALREEHAAKIIDEPALRDGTRALLVAAELLAIDSLKPAQLRTFDRLRGEPLPFQAGQLQLTLTEKSGATRGVGADAD